MRSGPRDAYRAAWQVIMSGGTLEAGLEAAEPHFRRAERERCAALLTTGTPLGFLRRHGLEPGATARDVLNAAAAEILAPGEDAPVRPCDGPGAAGQGAAGVTGYPPP